MGIFRKTSDPPRRNRSFADTATQSARCFGNKVGKAKIGCEKAQAAWESGLDGDDPKALDKAGPRLSEAKEFGSLRIRAR